MGAVPHRSTLHFEKVLLFQGVSEGLDYKGRKLSPERAYFSKRKMMTRCPEEYTPEIGELFFEQKLLHQLHVDF